MKISGPKILLHVEGLAALAIACIAYWRLGGSWLMFAALFLVPDLSMIAYALGTGVGARIYNAVHTYTTPLVIGILGYALSRPLLETLCAIWIAHIGFDRLLGFGLKYGTAFKDTHLSRV